MRGVVCKTSWAQKKVLEDLGQRMKKKLGNIKKLYIEKELRKTRKVEMLKILDEETKHWMYFENVENALKKSVLIPNNMYYQSDYYIKLQEKAMMLMGGQYDDVEDYKIDHEVLEYKNSILLPLYGRITGILSKMRKNDFERLYEEYEMTVYGLKETPLSEKEKLIRKNELGVLYEGLIMKLRADLKNNVKVRVALLEEKLLLTLNLLLAWRDYTSILNLSHHSCR